MHSSCLTSWLWNSIMLLWVSAVYSFSFIYSLQLNKCNQNYTFYGCISYFQFGSIGNNVVVNYNSCPYLWCKCICISIGYISRTGIMSSYFQRVSKNLRSTLQSYSALNKVSFNPYSYFVLINFNNNLFYLDVCKSYWDFYTLL